MAGSEMSAPEGDVLERLEALKRSPPDYGSRSEWIDLAMDEAAEIRAPEQTKLSDLEGIIERGLQTFVEVGAALSIIREQRLYRAGHATFEEYCRERWGWTRLRADQLIRASDAVQSLNTTVLPTNEAQARELVPVPEERRAEVWETAVAETNGKPTAKAVREAAEPALREQREMQATERERRGQTISLPKELTPEAAVLQYAPQREAGASLMDVANALGMHVALYAQMEKIVHLAHRTDLSARDRKEARAALDELNEGRQVTPAWRRAAPLFEKVYGNGKSPSLGRREAVRMEAFDRAFGALTQACSMAPEIEVPYLAPDRRTEVVFELEKGVADLRALIAKIMEAV